MPAGRVLYIEDRTDNQMLIKRVLMSEGLEVLLARSAIEGIQAAVGFKPDLILMDINMPEMDGYTATNELRKFPELNHVPIVALTANVMKGDREKTMAAGCDGYISKPIDVDRFPVEVINYIQKGRTT